MSNARFDLNDPRLTAYVLGELDESETARVESQLEQCEETRNAVEDIRAMTGLLAEQLQHEPTPALTNEQRAALIAETATATVTSGTTVSRRSSGWILITAGTAIIAGLLVFLSPDNQDESPEELASAYYLRNDVKSYDGEIDHLQGKINLNSVNESSIVEKLNVSSDLSVKTQREAIKHFVPSESIMTAPKSPAGHQPPPPERFTSDTPVQFRTGSPTGHLDQSKPSFATQGIQPGQAPTAGETSGLFKQASSMPVRRMRVRVRPGSISSRQKILEAKTRLGGTIFESALGDQNANKVFPQPQLGKAVTQYYDSLGTDLVQDSKKTDAYFYDDGENIVGLSIVPSQDGEFPKLRRQYSIGQNNTESYAAIIENQFLFPTKEPLATFGIDVDTAAYSNVRRFLNEGRLPPPNAVRIEEMINYFHYNEPKPTGDDPFSVSLEAADCPWNPGHRLIRVGLKGKEIDRSQRPNSNLVFLVDVSGSMKENNKLPLVRTALEMLAKQMTESDRIAIVTYAGEASLKLDSTSGQNKETILAAIRGLQANGSTNGEAGIKLAYAKAFENRIKNGANRVILCTDGDFNVGVSDDDELMQMVHKYADDSGVFLSIFGFGMGNLKDAKLEKLADTGNGHYGYVDNQSEAHKVFVEEMTGTLYTIAQDLKLQVEFNPYQVGAYRLIGYENRVMAAQDFDNDRKDAGDIGAGHSVTALFEIIPVDKLRQPVELKYQSVSREKNEQVAKTAVKNDINRELLTLFLRYKQPEGEKSVKREYPLVDLPNDSASPQASHNLQWSAAVAAFGMVLRDSQYQGLANYDLVQELAQTAKGKDPSGRRKEFLELVQKAKEIQHPTPVTTSASPEEKPIPPKATEIGKDVLYWKTYKIKNNEVKQLTRLIRALRELFPPQTQIKVEKNTTPGEIKIFGPKEIHDKLTDLLPRLIP